MAVQRPGTGSTGKAHQGMPDRMQAARQRNGQNARMDALVARKSTGRLYPVLDSYGT